MENQDSRAMTYDELKTALASAESRAAQAYQNGMNAAREFDTEMDGFLINFLRKDYSSIVIFAIAACLIAAGWILRGFF